MGSRMAQKLLDAGYSVVVYNRTKAKVDSLIDLGAIYAATPKEAAEQADVVISMVTNDEASQAIWLDTETGAVLGLSPDKIAIASSTLTVDWTQELAAVIANRGAAFLDAPVVGSRPQADAGKLIYLVGGQAETLAQVRDSLLAMGGAIHHVGSVGQGMAMKLAVNALFGIQVAALAEMLAMLTRQGISRADAMACLGELPVISLAAKGAGGLMVANNHAPLFPIELVAKDCRYALQTTPTVNATMPISRAIQSVYQDAIAQGYGSRNITGIMHLFTDIEQ